MVEASRSPLPQVALVFCPPLLASSSLAAIAATQAAFSSAANHVGGRGTRDHREHPQSGDQATWRYMGKVESMRLQSSTMLQHRLLTGSRICESLCTASNPEPPADPAQDAWKLRS